jgi:hypothetical protein
MKKNTLPALLPVAAIALAWGGSVPAATVTITDAAGVAVSCGNLSSLSQTASGQISMVVTGNCLGQSDGGTNPPPDDGGENPPPPPSPPPSNSNCVNSDGIVCKDPIDGGKYVLPSFEATTISIQPGEVHVYPFVYQASFGKGKVGPAFGERKIVKISTQPGDVSQDAVGCYQLQRYNLSTLKYENAATPISRFACDLTVGVQYYLNIKTTRRTVDEYRLRANPGF